MFNLLFILFNTRSLEFFEGWITGIYWCFRSLCWAWCIGALVVDMIILGRYLFGKLRFLSCISQRRLILIYMRKLTMSISWDLVFINDHSLRWFFRFYFESHNSAMIWDLMLRLLYSGNSRVLVQFYWFPILFYWWCCWNFMKGIYWYIFELFINIFGGLKIVIGQMISLTVLAQMSIQKDIWHFINLLELILFCIHFLNNLRFRYLCFFIFFIIKGLFLDNSLLWLKFNVVKYSRIKRRFAIFCGQLLYNFIFIEF